MEGRQIVALFYERSEQAIAELDRTYSAAVAREARGTDFNYTVEKPEALADIFDFSIL